MEQGRAGERARCTGQGKTGYLVMLLTWMVVDLNIMSWPRVPTLGIYSRMILQSGAHLLCTYYHETGSCMLKMLLCTEHTNSSMILHTNSYMLCT